MRLGVALYVPDGMAANPLAERELYTVKHSAQGGSRLSKMGTAGAKHGTDRTDRTDRTDGGSLLRGSENTTLDRCLPQMRETYMVSKMRLGVAPSVPDGMTAIPVAERELYTVKHSAQGCPDCPKWGWTIENGKLKIEN